MNNMGISVKFVGLNLPATDSFVLRLQIEALERLLTTSAGMLGDSPMNLIQVASEAILPNDRRTSGPGALRLLLVDIHLHLR
jgi:hypothetical protein